MGPSSGQVSAPIADEFDLLSVNHFFNVFELYYDVLFPSTRRRR